MHPNKTLLMKFEKVIDVNDIPLNVVKHYLNENSDLPIKMSAYTIPTDGEYEPFVAAMDQMEFRELALRAQQMEQEAISTSGYYNLSRNFQKNDMVPMAYDHKSAFAAIEFLHLNYDTSQSVLDMLDKKFPLPSSVKPVYDELRNKTEPTPKEVEKMDELDKQRVVPYTDESPEIVLCRGIPTIEDDRHSTIYKLAQSVLELPFAFCKVVYDGVNVQFETQSTTSYIDGLTTVYGLSKSFAYDISKTLKRLWGTIVEPPLLSSNHYDNAIKIMSLFADDRTNCIKAASHISRTLYNSVSEPRQRKYFKNIPAQFADAINTKPVMWTESFGFRELPEKAYSTFRTYTRYLLLLQELRGKKDKFSDKMYRLPVGGGPVQIHLENAAQLAYRAGKPVVVVHADTGTLLKMAWAIKIYDIQGVFVNMTPVPGKLSELKDIMITDLKGKIIFNYDCVTISSPRQEKAKSEQDLFEEVYTAHFNYFNSLPVGMAFVAKSFYFPQIEGVTYFRSSEPHNGSCIVYKSKTLTKKENTYEEKWAATMQMRKANITYSYYKTMFTLSRELVMRKVYYRIPMRVEPLAPTLTPDILPDDGDVPAEMGTLEDEYPPDNPLPVAPAGGGGAPVPQPQSEPRLQWQPKNNSSMQIPALMTTTAARTTTVTTTSTSTTTQTTTATPGGLPAQGGVRNQNPQRKKRNKQVKTSEDDEPGLDNLNDD
jgi:hypothetical protein